MKARFKQIIWPLIYLVLIINVCISFILVFRSYYFRSIFVSGSSMEPTLHGDRGLNSYADYGIIDNHKSAINNLKRFQIITTYYPFKDSSDYIGGYVHGGENEIDPKESSYKIKRVYGMPGETIKFVVDETWVAEAKQYYDQYSEKAQYAARQAIQFYVKKTPADSFKKQNIKFKRKISTATFDKYKDFEVELGEDEYWVMGDNYSASADCFSKNAPIYRDNIVGVLIAIEGTCKINFKAKEHVDTTDDGTKDYYYECVDRKRHFPVFY